MSKDIGKSYNITVLLYHLVFPVKYRKAVIDEHVNQVMKNICLEMIKRYQINFLEMCARFHVIEFRGKNLL